MADKDFEKDQVDSQASQEELSDWQKLHAEYRKRKAEQEAAHQEAVKQRMRDIQGGFAEADFDDEDDWVEEDLSGRALRQAERRRRRQAKADKKAEKAARRNPVWRRHVSRAVPVLIAASLMAIVSIYFISPYSKIKNLKAAGNEETPSQQIVDSALVDPRDYTATIFLKRADYARNVKKSNPWVETARMDYQFPTTFTIRVTEYGIIGYRETSGQYYPILRNGKTIETPMPEDRVPSDHLTLNFSNEGVLKEFIKQYDRLSDKTRKEIVTVSHTPSNATKDLLTITTRDDHKILVPLSQLAQKMAYYQSIAARAEEPLQIDMEAGIFSTPLSTLADQSSKKLKGKDEEKVDENGNPVEESTNQDSNSNNQAANGNQENGAAAAANAQDTATPAGNTGNPTP